MSTLKFNRWQRTNGSNMNPVINAYHASNNTSYSVAATSGFDLTNMIITVTPVSATSRFLLMFNTIGGFNTGTGATTSFWITKNDSSLNSATTGNYNGQTGWIAAAADRTATAVLNHIDSPGTTSPITYKVRMATDGTAFIGRRSSDTFIVCSQHFTVLEFLS